MAQGEQHKPSQDCPGTHWYSDPGLRGAFLKTPPAYSQHTSQSTWHRMMKIHVHLQLAWACDFNFSLCFSTGRLFCTTVIIAVSLSRVKHEKSLVESSWRMHSCLVMLLSVEKFSFLSCRFVCDYSAQAINKIKTRTITLWPWYHILMFTAGCLRWKKINSFHCRQEMSQHDVWHGVCLAINLYK